MTAITKPIFGTSDIYVAPSVVVTAAAGSAGQSLTYSGPSAVAFTLINLSPVFGVEYKLGTGPWRYLGKKVGTTVEGSPSGLLLRLVNDGATAVQLDLSTEGALSIDGVSLSAGSAGVAPYDNLTAVIVGDSIAAANMTEQPVTIVDNGDGTATITRTGANDLDLYTGDLFSVGGHGTPKFNQINARVLSHTLTGQVVTSITYSLGGIYGAQPQSGGAAVYAIQRESDKGFASFGKAFSGARFKILGNFASGGSDSDNMMLLLPHALALRPAVVIGQIGTNNVYARQWNAAKCIDSMKAAFDYIAGQGVIPVFGLIPPHSDAADSAGIGLNSAANAATVGEVNRWMSAYLPSIGGVAVQTWEGTCNGLTYGDLASSLGLANAGMLRDGVHNARQGGLSSGKMWGKALEKVFALAPARRPVNPTNIPAGHKKYYPNVLFAETYSGLSAGTPGAGTGTLVAGSKCPAGVSVSNQGSTSAQTLETLILPRTEQDDGDAIGNKLRIKVTGMQAGSSVLVRIVAPTTGWTYGETIEASARVRMSSYDTPGSGNPQGVVQPQLSLSISTATTGPDVAYALGSFFPGDPVNEGAVYDLTTQAYAFKSGGNAVHGGLVFMRWEVNIFAREASAKACIDISWPDIDAVVASS